MQITLELPNDIARHSDPDREALERLAIEGYRSGVLTHFQAGQLLGFSSSTTSWLSAGSTIMRTRFVDLQQDLADIEKLRAQGLLGK
jgi:hypothetical protein